MQDPDLQGGEIAGRFEIVRELEAGGGGGRVYVVRRARDDTGALFVLKHFDPSGGRLNAILREKQSVDILIERGQQLGLIVDHGVGESEFWYTMPFHDGPNLHDWTVRQSRKWGKRPDRHTFHHELLTLLCGILRQVAVLHAHGLAHRDIKPGNIIVTATGPQLIDFGLLTAVGSAALLTTSGTPHYKDPRMDSLRLRALRVADVDPKAFDIYSLGALLYFLFEVDHPVDGGLSPFTARTPLAVQHVFRVATARHGERYPDVAAMLADAEVLRDAAAGGRLDTLSPLALPGMARGLALNGTGDLDVKAEASGPRSVTPSAAVAGASVPLKPALLRPSRRRLLAAAAVLLVVALVGGIMAMTGDPDGEGGGAEASGDGQPDRNPSTGLSAIQNQPAADMEVLLDEDFESYDLGSWPTGWIADANAADQPSRNRVVADPDDPKNKVLQLYGAAQNNWAALAYLPLPLGDQFSVSFLVWNGDETLSGMPQVRACLTLHQRPLWSAFTSPSATLLSFKDTGFVSMLLSDAMSYYETRRWYQVECSCRIDGDLLTLTGSIDGVPIGTFEQTLPDGRLRNMEYLGIHASSGTVFYDNLRVSGPANIGVNTGPLPHVVLQDFESSDLSTWPERWVKLRPKSDHVPWSQCGIVRKSGSESGKSLKLHSGSPEAPMSAAFPFEVPRRFTLSMWLLPEPDESGNWNGRLMIGLCGDARMNERGLVDSLNESRPTEKAKPEPPDSRDQPSASSVPNPIARIEAVPLFIFDHDCVIDDFIGSPIRTFKPGTWYLIELRAEVTATELRVTYATAGMTRGPERVFPLNPDQQASPTALLVEVSGGSAQIDEVRVWEGK